MNQSVQPRGPMYLTKSAGPLRRYSKVWSGGLSESFDREFKIFIADTKSAEPASI